MAGPPESVFDWTREIGPDFSNQNANSQAFSRKHWRLVQCQNGQLLLLLLLLLFYLFIIIIKKKISLYNKG